MLVYWRVYKRNLPSFPDNWWGSPGPHRPPRTGAMDDEDQSGNARLGWPPSARAGCRTRTGWVFNEFTLWWIKNLENDRKTIGKWWFYGILWDLPCFTFWWINRTIWKISILNGKIDYRWSVSIAMLNYQSVSNLMKPSRARNLRTVWISMDDWILAI